MSQEQRTTSGAESLSRSPSPEPQLERSQSDEAAPRRRPYKRRGKESRGLDLPLEDTSRSLTQTVGQVGQTANQVGQTAQQAAGPGKDTLKLRLDLNLDVDIQIKARVHGDITLSLLD